MFQRVCRCLQVGANRSEEMQLPEILRVLDGHYCQCSLRIVRLMLKGGEAIDGRQEIFGFESARCKADLGGVSHAP